MSGEKWKTGVPATRSQPNARPTRGQIARQLVIMVFIGAVWTLALGLFLSVTGTGAENVILASVQSNITPVRPTATLPALPTSTSLPAATATSSSTSTPASAATKPPGATSTSAPAVTPTLVPSPTAAPTATATVATSDVSFSRNVLPIFTQVCVKCHGGEKTQHGLSLKTYDDVMAGSENGYVIVPGDPVNSVLIDLITKGKMPKQGPRLLPAEIKLITEWVKDGAPNN